MRFDIDQLEEILSTVSRNKMRSVLTAFGVFWGIFMLVVLSGGGLGFMQMMTANFEGFATNSGFIMTSSTELAYKGFQKGRMWNLDSTDPEVVKCRAVSRALLPTMGPLRIRTCRADER